MKQIRNLFALCLILCLTLSLSATAHAKDVPQLDRTGEITITMHLGTKPVGGGTLTLYRVGAVQEDDGNYTFQPTGDFTACGKTFETLTPSLAEDLAKYARDQKLTGVTLDIDKDGKVLFEDLEVGLYLFVQNKAAAGYNKANPFLVTLPYREDNGTYRYQVDASPKVELEREPEPTTPPPTKPHEPSLPQTGQLNWPVPVLATLGLLLFAAGWLLRFGKRKDNAE